MKTKFSKKKIFQLILLVILILGISYLQKNYETESVEAESAQTELTDDSQNSEAARSENTQQDSSQSIDRLTEEKTVALYVKEHGKLPNYYLTKSQARKKGWSPQKGNLCDVLPGKAIGGDRFGNREGKLPNQKGRTYYEADLNYDCGHRNADRLIYSNDGLVFITKDHYKTFQKQ